MSFADVVLTQIPTFSDEDVTKIYYAMKSEYEKRSREATKKSEQSNLEKIEAYWPNVYDFCTQVVAHHLDELNFNIIFTPKEQYLVMGNFSGTRSILRPPYSIRLGKTYNGGFEATVDLNCANSCVSYPDLCYSYQGKNAGSPLVAKRTDLLDKCLPSQLNNVPIVAHILTCPEKVWKALVTK
jgi:hypothetical protein